MNENILGIIILLSAYYALAVFILGSTNLVRLEYPIDVDSIFVYDTESVVPSQKMATARWGYVLFCLALSLVPPILGVACLIQRTWAGNSLERWSRTHKVRQYSDTSA